MADVPVELVCALVARFGTYEAESGGLVVRVTDAQLVEADYVRLAMWRDVVSGETVLVMEQSPVTWEGEVVDDGRAVHGRPAQAGDDVGRRPRAIEAG
jgi:hypothetical protein